MGGELHFDRRDVHDVCNDAAAAGDRVRYQAAYLAIRAYERGTTSPSLTVAARIGGAFQQAAGMADERASMAQPFTSFGLSWSRCCRRERSCDCGVACIARRSVCLQKKKGVGCDCASPFPEPLEGSHAD